MTLHLIKLCVGCDSIDDLVQWQAERRARGEEIGHTTRMFPKRRNDVLDGGSLYWVIRGQIQVRQEIIDLVSLVEHDGVSRCRIVLDPSLVIVRPTPRKAFQGWRYFDHADIPHDLGIAIGEDIPPQMRKELLELGLL
ncbi:hypothetical protein FHS85_003401 [Rhodoligotrophos appendicifer]|uniref:DUF1489 family protein n=1 Tax=Rhodoligotrophos appendicifer TaxID=987056 RepID=UPI001185573F|nr:DUF1489 domain-containing protein [Rhodoligotrophos appendicifer]